MSALPEERRQPHVFHADPTGGAGKAPGSQYPEGCTVVLERMCDPYRESRRHDGKVIHVDDAGGIHVAWSNGSTLAALHGIDRIRRID